MNRATDINHLVDRVSLFDLRTYLERKGWRRLATRNDKLTVFALEDDQNTIELALPSQEHFSDVKQRIVQVIQSLSQIENLTTREICTAILGTNSDSLLVRLQIPSNKSSLPIEDAPRHVKAISDLLLFSACSEVNAKPHYEKQLSAASKLMSNFEFCHTFSGSFGFEVSSYVEKPQQINDLFVSPKQRLIVERIARGFILLNEAVATDSPEILIRAYETALNARMCDAITDISIDGKFTFNFGIDWASSISPAEDVRSFHEQEISEPQVSMLKHVSEQLKIVEPYAESIQGSVINLHCITNPTENNSRRTILLKVNHEKHGRIEVAMSLAPNYYLLAIETHTKGGELRARGQLQRKGSTWSMEGVTFLEIAKPA